MIRNERGDLQADPIKIVDVWKSYFEKLLNVHNGEETEEFEIHTAEPWIPEPSETEIEMSVKKLKNFKSPGIDNIPAELIKAGGTALIKELHKLISAIWRKEELPKKWKTSIIVPIYKKKGDKSDCNNYKVLSNILLIRLSVYVDEIIGDHQCGFRRNRSTLDQIFALRQFLEKKWEYSGTVHQLFIDFKKAYRYDLL